MMQLIKSWTPGNWKYHRTIEPPFWIHLSASFVGNHGIAELPQDLVETKTGGLRHGGYIAIGIHLIHLILVGGWATPLKNMKVNWDDDIPNISGKIKNGNQTTNQKWMEIGF